MNPLLEFVRFDLDIFGYDSIPIYIDNLNLFINQMMTITNYNFLLILL